MSKNLSIVKAKINEEKYYMKRHESWIERAKSSLEILLLSPILSAMSILSTLLGELTCSNNLSIINHVQRSDR